MAEYTEWIHHATIINDIMSSPLPACGAGCAAHAHLSDGMLRYE